MLHTRTVGPDVMRAFLRRDRNLWLTMFLCTAAVYLLTARWSSGQISDAYGAAYAGWQFVHTGGFDVASADGFSTSSRDSYVTVGDELRPARMAGVIIAGIPFHAALAWTGLSATTTGTLAAVVLSAAAIANLAVVLRRIVPLVPAVAGATTLGFGTAMWTISADQLWSHGPDAFWLSCGLVAVVRGSAFGAGFALAAAVTTRPHLALVAAALGCVWAIRDRSLRRLVAVGLPGAGAIAFLLWWNGWYYGAESVGGGYSYAATNVTRAPSEAAGTYLEALAGTLVSPVCGIFVYTPAAFLAVLAVRGHLRAAPWWAWTCAGGGALYLAVQMRISADFSGGGGFYSNRYAVETLVLSTPLAVAAVHSWCAGSARRRAVAGCAAALSIAIHAYGEILSYALVGLGTASNWAAWYPYYIGRAAGYTAVVTAVTGLLFVMLVGVLSHRSFNVAAAPAASPPRAPLAPSSAVPAQRPGAAASTRR